MPHPLVPEDYDELEEKYARLRKAAEAFVRGLGSVEELRAALEEGK